MKTFLTLLFEPTALVLLALVAGMSLIAPRLGVTRLMLAFLPVLLVYLIFATPAGANALLAPLESRAARPTPACGHPADRDLVVLLSGGAHLGARSSADIGMLTLASFRRTVAAVDFGLQVPGSRLLISGGAAAGVPEARILRSLAARLGFPADRLIVEDRSRTTAESATAVRRIADRLGATRVELVTSAMHMPRSLASFARAGIEVCPRPTDFQRVPVHFPSELLPQISALEKSTEALHEYLGLLAYSVTGRA
jgi:uncharacterized SAM-binding protein YcdF (DUF218 family)